MNSIKSMVLGVTLLFSVAIIAQNQEVRKNGKVQQMTEELNLTEEQQKEVTLIFQEIRKEKQVIKSNEKLTPEEKKKSAMELKEKTDAKLKAAITKEQYAKYTALKEERKESKKQEKTEKKAEFYQTLNLSEKQIMEMESLQMKIKTQKKSIHDNASMTVEQRKKALKDLRASKEEAEKGILSEEQYRQMKELKKEKRGEKGKGHMRKSRQN